MEHKYNFTMYDIMYRKRPFFMQELRKNMNCGKIIPDLGGWGVVRPKAEKKIVSVGAISRFIKIPTHLKRCEGFIPRSGFHQGSVKF